MNKKIFVLAILALVLLAACQNSPAVPQTPTTNPGRTPVKETLPPVEEIVPTLKISLAGQTGEFKLRSQTAKYLNSKNSSAEIILSNSYAVSCENLQPKLQDQDQQIKITIKAKDGKTPLSKVELANNPAFELTLSKITKDGETKLDSKLIDSLNITDLNKAILRGNFKTHPSTDNKVESWDGEFFTAICR